MTSGHKVTQAWSGTVRFRIASEAGTPGMGDTMFYDWHLAFAYGSTRDALMADLKSKVDSLEANGRIIGGVGDPIEIQCVTTKTVTRSLDEFRKEVGTAHE